MRAQTRARSIKLPAAVRVAALEVEDAFVALPRKRAPSRTIQLIGLAPNHFGAGRQTIASVAGRALALVADGFQSIRDADATKQGKDERADHSRGS